MSGSPIRETWLGPIGVPATPGPELCWPETKHEHGSIPPARDQISKIVGRPGRANAALSRKVSAIRDLENCVVGPGTLTSRQLFYMIQLDRLV